MNHQKLFGQNFLHDKKTINKIVEEAGKGVSNLIIEVGPGKGAITNELMKLPKKLIAIEKDYKLADKLTEKNLENENFSVIPADVLKVDLQKIIFNEKEEKAVIASNLPYSVGSRIFVELCKISNVVEFAVLMFQKEVADRIGAKPDSKDYGILSIIAQTKFKIESVCIVPPHAFKPAPKVDSKVIKAIPIESKINENDFNEFIEFIKKPFTMRRKTLRKSLSHITEETFKNAGIDPIRRPETLEIEEFIKLFYEVKKQN